MYDHSKQVMEGQIEHAEKRLRQLWEKEQRSPEDEIDIGYWESFLEAARQAYLDRYADAHDS